MWKRMAGIVTLSAGVCLLAAAQASAQDFNLTLFGGYSNPGKLTVDNVRTGLRGDATAGVRFEVDFARIIGMENTLAVIPDFAAPDLLGTVKSAKGIIYSANLVANIPIGQFVPYVTAGVGLIHSNRSFAAIPSPPPGSIFGNNLAVNYGGGLKFIRLAGPLGVRFDVRGYALPDVFSQTLNLFEVSGGIMFSF